MSDVSGGTFGDPRKVMVEKVEREKERIGLLERRDVGKMDRDKMVGYVRELEHECKRLSNQLSIVQKVVDERALSDKTAKEVSDRLNDANGYWDASCDEGLTDKTLMFDVRRGLHVGIGLDPALFPKDAIEHLGAAVRANWPVFRRSGLRVWMEKYAMKYILDTRYSRVQMFLRAIDVLETCFREVPVEVMREVHGLAQRKAILRGRKVKIDAEALKSVGG